MSNSLPAEDQAPVSDDQKDFQLLDVKGLEKTFKQAHSELTIFKNLSLSLEKGEMIALVGQSGAGKSTLLQLIGLLDSPTAGSIIIHGQDMSKANDRQRTSFRNQEIGFVYQFHHLQSEFSALENAMMPLLIAGEKKAVAEQKASEILDSFGLSERKTHRPARLSGGEQQRVAIARALANNPSLILADEPTGNLDPATSSGVFDILIERVKQRGIGALIATHNMDLADQMDRVLELKQGRLVIY